MKYLFYVTFFLANGALVAQTPFWTEDFANGIPATWTNTDASNQSAIWGWCNDPASNGAVPGCPSVWAGGGNDQSPFQATTAENGFVSLDSDEYGELATDHISQLTTGAINCSGKSQIFIRFQTHLGTFTYDADERAIVRVSTDQVNWTSFQIFTGLTTEVRWSENPYIAIADLSSAAANQSTVYIQFQWTGNYEYHWSIDDIEIFSENPTPPNDLALGDVFFPLSSFATPASEIQTDTCIFYAYVSNNGLLGQTNVKLKAWVTDQAENVLFADSTTIGSLPTGYKDSIIVLENLWAPEVEEGLYTIHYAVSADSVDGRASDNIYTTEFAATNFFFAKEDGPEQFFRPGTLTDPWYVCNYYRFSKKSLEKYRAVSIDFAHTVNESELDITEVTAGAYLLRVNDNVNDELSNLDPSDFFASLNWLGLGEYAADASTVDDGSIRTVPIFDLGSGNEGVELETGGRYIAAIVYAGVNNKVFQAYNNDNKYFFTSTLQYGGGNFFTFGEDVNAVVRLNLGLVSTTDETPLADEAMLVSPNPAKNQINLGVKLAEAGPATVTIADLSGRIVLTRDYENLHQQVLNYQLPKLSGGVYLARIATEKGTLTKRFTIAQ